MKPYTKWLRTFAFTALTVFTINSCSAEKAMEKSTQIDITLGEASKDFLERYPDMKVSDLVTPEHGTMFWYQQNWTPKKPATISIKAPEQVAQFPEAIYLNIAEHSLRKDQGITSFNFQAGISPEDWISHEDARIKFHEILQRLVKNGWQYASSPYYPRLTGKEAFKYKIAERKFLHLDPEYILTKEEWNGLERDGASSINYWGLHLNSKLFLKIKLGINNHENDKNLGVYLMFIEVHNAEEKARLQFDPEDKGKWKSKWAEMLAEAKEERAKAEAVAKEKGYTIDESYQDFVINPADF